MNIRIRGEFGGILIVITVGLILTAMIAGILNFIKNKVFKDRGEERKIFSILVTGVWILGIIVIILDLIGVLPIIRNLLFALLE